VKHNAKQICRHVALSGGVGGAKLVVGLNEVVAPEQLCIIANTGDDFEHLGVHISPDLDTLMYSLASLANPDTGWGVTDETWDFMAALEELGADTWFQIGDRDLATHVERTRLLDSGESLSQTTEALCKRLGIATRIVPMTDGRVRTMLQTDDGLLEFQDYFVRQAARPRISEILYEGATSAEGSPAALKALASPDLEAVLLTPSNPYLSIDPILGISDISSAIKSLDVPVIAVSPIVGGQAIKGPTAKIMNELGADVSPVEVALHYQGIIDGMIIDQSDSDCAEQIAAMGIAVKSAQTVMNSMTDKIELARLSINFASTIDLQNKCDENVGVVAG
jgi:LPPG:FO 2-phospho-L-lactate transferase